MEKPLSPLPLLSSSSPSTSSLLSTKNEKLPFAFLRLADLEPM
jgi:hypothetical protein